LVCDKCSGEHIGIKNFKAGLYYKYIITYAQVFFKIKSVTETHITFYHKHPLGHYVCGGTFEREDTKIVEDTKNRDYFEHLWTMNVSDEVGFQKLGI